jgi:hypothetical protein
MCHSRASRDNNVPHAAKQPAQELASFSCFFLSHCGGSCDDSSAYGSSEGLGVGALHRLSDGVVDCEAVVDVLGDNEGTDVGHGLLDGVLEEGLMVASLMERGLPMESEMTRRKPRRWMSRKATVTGSGKH